MAKRRRRYMQDIFTTLVDAQWRWTILIFAMSFILTWAAFAGVWYVIAYAHGDLEYAERVRLYGADALNESFIPCVTEVKSFATSFLFSVETQHTIGKWWTGREFVDVVIIPLFILDFVVARLCRLWQSVYNRRVSGGHFRNVHPMHYGRVHTGVYGWHCICKIVAAEETGSDAAVFQECGYLPS